MKIEYTGRHIAVSPALRRHAAERLAKIARHMNGASEAHVILAVEKRQHIAEVVVVGKREKLSSEASTEDMYASLNRALDKIERQAKKHREKLVLGKRRQSSKGASRRRGEGEEEQALMPLPAETREITLIEVESVAPPQMTMEKAALALESSVRPFVLFREKATASLRLIYRRADGRLALIEPTD